MEKVRNPVHQGWYFTIDSTKPDGLVSQSPSYPTHDKQDPNIKLR